MESTYKDARLADIVAKNNELETLKALQMKVAQTLDSTKSARDIAALSKQLREITEKITLLGGSEYHDDITALLDERLLAGRPGYVRERTNTL